MRRYLIVPLVAVLATACASALAKSPPDQPALNVPPPPPHEIQLPAEPLEPVGEVTASPGTTPAASRSPRPAAPKPETPKPEPPKADNPPAAPPPTTPEPAPNLPPPAPAPQLNTPQTADTAAAKAVRTMIDRARSTLRGVKYDPLSNERKKAYKDAQLFLDQAEDALKDGNIVFAQAVATKGDTLARELASR